MLEPENIPALANAYIIAEIHDFIDGSVGETVSSKLTSTHVIEEVRTQTRTFTDFHEPRALWNLKQYADELRPGSRCFKIALAVSFKSELISFWMKKRTDRDLPWSGEAFVAARTTL